MSDQDETASNALTRVPTGLAGLDAILQGGFFRGGVYMAMARPGSGKTILGNQICFRHVASGGRALYVTLLAESHARMIAAIKPMEFYDWSRVGSTLTYLSGYDALDKGKLKGLLGLLRKEIQDHEATFLVLDGLVTVGAMAESELETKKFIHELQVFVELVGCTTLLLTGGQPNEQYALRTMVDGLLEMKVEPVGMEVWRTLEVTKFRGGANLLGSHLFEISDAGITVHPRTESRRGLVPVDLDPALVSVLPFGIPGLDRSLAGGLRSDATTLILGAPGSGKTILGLSFLAAGATAGQPGLYFGFFEPPGILRRKADAVGLGLSDHTKSGVLELMWQSSRATAADASAERLLSAVRERGVRRLFVDGLDGFQDSLVHAGRTRLFFGALCDELRSMGVAVVVSQQTASLDAIEFPEHGLTSMFDNVISLRHVEMGTRLRKIVSVVKMREGEGDFSLQEFTIDRRGLVVSGTDDPSPTRPRAKTARQAKGKRGR
jgi:circadian clock protein KaiC